LGRAIVLTGLTPELRVHRAHGLHVFERKFESAEAELLAAIREKPTFAKTYGFLSMLYVSMGRFEEGLKILEQGYKTDPLFPVLPAVEVSVHFFARNYDAAIACGRKSLDLHPYILVGRSYYAQALEYAGQLETALQEYRTACLMLPGLLWLRVLEAACLSKCGGKRAAIVILNEIEQTRKTEYVDAYYVSLLYAALGMADRAFAELERAIQENSVTLCLLDVDPKMDILRRDPRFQNIRRRLLAQTPVSLLDSSQKLSARA
jgi:tetratricopeptide (TPR) repeat protein